jgi:hypothetical protein
LDDVLFEGDETIGLLLSNPTGGASLGVEKSALLTITENDAPPPAGSLQFSGAEFSAPEDAGIVTITVTRSGGSFGAVTVNYSTTEVTASAGLDYAASPGTLTFADGELSKTFTVSIFDDADYEGDERIQLHLATPVGGAALGTMRDATLIIRENDVPPPAGSLQLSGAEYVFTEGDGVVSITVTRTGGSAGAAGIDYATGDGSARGGNDYVASNGNLLFTDGVISGTIDLEIIDDNIHEAPETLFVTLSNPTGGALGQPNVVEIAILDNDSQPASATSSRGGGGGAVDVLFAVLLLVMIFRNRRMMLA